MGKGDRRTAKGKRFSKSFGKSRKKSSKNDKKSDGTKKSDTGKQ
jgi:ribosomal small subunit protein bTHX